MKLPGGAFPSDPSGSHRINGSSKEKIAVALICGVVGLISIGLYTATLAPGLTWAHQSGDGGELAAAARVLGIPHPPGYPTYVLLAYPFTRLPFGEVATRTNFFSALCAACTAALLSWTLIRARCRKMIATAVGLALACAPLLWSQAIVTEVHTLNSLFAMVLLTLATTGTEQTRGTGAWVALATGGFWGLGMGNHPTLLFCAPIVGLALWRVRSRWAWAVTGLVLGLLTYVYLPIRASANPAINWGDPDTAARFWWTISGGPYRQFLFSLPPAYLPARVLAWLALARQQFTWLGFIAAVVGGTVLWHSRRGLLLSTAAATLLYSIFAVGYNTSDSQFYLLPPLVCMGLWVGVGIEHVLALLETRWSWARRWVAVPVMILPLLLAVWRFPTLDLSEDRQALDFQRGTLEQAPPYALLLSRQDVHTFALWYGQIALGERPDITIVDLDLLAYEWYTVDMSEIVVQTLRDMEPAAAAQRSEVAHILNRPTCTIEAEGLTCALPPTERK